MIKPWKREKIEKLENLKENRINFKHLHQGGEL